MWLWQGGDSAAGVRVQCASPGDDPRWSYAAVAAATRRRHERRAAISRTGLVRWRHRRSVLHHRPQREWCKSRWLIWAIVDEPVDDCRTCMVPARRLSHRQARWRRNTAVMTSARRLWEMLDIKLSLSSTLIKQEACKRHGRGWREAGSPNSLLEKIVWYARLESKLRSH